ncbi:MAG: VanZ family protein [Pleomorphochaeta sp.]
MKHDKETIEKGLKIVSLIGFIMSIIIVVIITFLSLSPSENLISVSFIPFGDKGAHMLAYAGLGLFMYFSFVKYSYDRHHKDRDLINSNWLLLPSLFTVILGMLLGIIIELIQIKVDRQFEFLDIVSDGLGLLVGCAIGFYILKFILKLAIKRNN